MPSRYVARNRLGSVATSPAAVTIGAATLSRSQRRVAHCDATPIVIARTTIDESNAPTTATTMKSAIEIDGSTPNATAIDFASTASANDVDSDSTSAAAMF